MRLEWLFQGAVPFSQRAVEEAAGLIRDGDEQTHMFPSYSIGGSCHHGLVGDTQDAGII